MNRPATYDAFVSDFHEYMTHNPNVCADLGVDKHQDDLPDPSLEDARSRVTEARALLDRARAFDRAGLDFDATLDLDLAALMLEAAIHNETYTFNGRTTRQQMPRAGDDISSGIFLYFVNDPRPAGERLANIMARIDKVPEYLDALAARLDTPVARWVNIDLDKIAGLPDLFTNLRDWAQAVAWPDTALLGQAIDRANAALERYAGALRGMPTTGSFHIGDAEARRIVKLRGIELSLEELRDIAAGFLAETLATIEELRAGLADKYGLDRDATAEQVHRYLNQRFAVAPPGTDLELILARYRDERDKILSYVRERDLFPIPDAQDMKILRTPAFMAPSIPAGAMQPPPPFRGGVRTSLVYLTLSEELRDEHTALGIPGMMIHEGIPGHHLQLATAAMHPSVIRRHVNASEHAEGWTTMLEDYMLDMGYMGELTDEARFVGKRDIARIGARVAIDLYFMTGDRGYLDVGVRCDLSSDDPFEAAGNLLAAVTGFVPGRVQAELNWYSQERAYPLSYLTGNRLVWQLKRDMQQARGGLAQDADLDRAFHTIYLESGNMPLSFLRRVFQHHGAIEERA
jgi:uncharacterized protein (DUF885 family)